MSGKNKKALIITYYWPPAGGPGVQRVLNIVEHLPEFGWEPLVLTVKEPSAPSIDRSLLERIPENIKVYKTNTREPFNAYKKLTGRSKGSLPKNIALESNTSLKEKLSRWVRANLFIPDARKGWKRFMVKEGMKVIEQEQPDIIFSTSPPHSLQIGAQKLAQKSGLPWVCDLRDPWTEAYWESKMPKTAISRKRNAALERSALCRASHITTVGNGIKDLLKRKADTPVSVIYNGYRELQIESVKTNKFDILHLGNLSNMQYCDTLFEALQRLDDIEKKKIRFTLIGNVAEEHKEKLSSLGRIEVEYLDFMPYSDMVKRASSASMLFLPKLDSSYSKGLISAKIFDYLALLKPIVAITDVGSDIGVILEKTGSGRSFLPNESVEMTHYLSDLIARADKNSAPILAKTDELKKYSSTENTRILTEIFEKVRLNT